MKIGNDCDITAEELYSSYLKGDENAFEELVAMFEDELSSFIYNKVHDYHEAKHITIESFARLATVGSFEGRSSIKTYLFAIAKNLASGHMKLLGQEQNIPFEDVIGTLVDEGISPQQYMERDESRKSIREAMQDLKEDYRVVLELLYFEDMSYAEVGRHMKKSLDQIKILAFRAKASLKKKLESRNFIE